jgi:hypothetical protein
MRRALYASLAAACLIVLLLLILRLPSESGVIGSLKRGSTHLLVPGTYIGFILAGGRIDDISFGIADIFNFVFYAALFYIVAAARDRYRAR